jgi:hypothetical protein
VSGQRKTVDGVFSLPLTPRLLDALKHWRQVIGVPDPYPGDRLIATCNAAGVVAEAAAAAEDGAVAQLHAQVSTIRDVIAALDSTRWSSGCWCSGKDKRGHSATCAGREAAIVSARLLIGEST